MASPMPSREFLRSKFDNVFQILPEGHDKALKQAFYSTAATLFVVLACCAAVAVYHILLPFIRPLMWALLCGTVLFPLKYRLVSSSRQWLGGLRSSGTPLLLGTILLPVTVADSAVTKAGSILQVYIVPVAIMSILLPAVYFLVFVWLGQAFLDSVLIIFSYIDCAVGYFRALWVRLLFFPDTCLLDYCANWPVFLLNYASVLDILCNRLSWLSVSFLMFVVLVKLYCIV